ncbi:MAG: EamA family transporter [Deltaproteobacteria bacterium]|nr:EamA family transporter [Deltaproteobacteria bacterium]
MTPWFLFTVGALVLFGVQRFLYKVSAERGCNTAWTSFAFMGTVAALSTAFFIATAQKVEGFAFFIIISFVNSATFLTGTMTTMEALKRVPASIAYPLIRLNTGIVVIFSVLYFKDDLSPCQVGGILLAMVVILLLAGLDDERKNSRGETRAGLLLVFVASLAGAIAAISSKFAALHTNILGFMALSYLMSMVFSFALRNRLQRNGENGCAGEALRIGFFMGLVNFLGFYSLLRALSMGPLSLIISITGMYFIVAIILSLIFYRERLTFTRVFAIILTVLSIVLMRM